MSEHAHKGTSIWKKKKKRGNSCLGMLIKGTRDWKVKRGLKYAQNMSTIAKKQKQKKTTKKQTKIFYSQLFF